MRTALLNKIEKDLRQNCSLEVVEEGTFDLVEIRKRIPLSNKHFMGGTLHGSKIELVVEGKVYDIYLNDGDRRWYVIYEWSTIDNTSTDITLENSHESLGNLLSEIFYILSRKKLENMSFADRAKAEVDLWKEFNFKHK